PELLAGVDVVELASVEAAKAGPPASARAQAAPSNRFDIRLLAIDSTSGPWCRTEGPTRQAVRLLLSGPIYFVRRRDAAGRRGDRSPGECRPPRRLMPAPAQLRSAR